MAERVAVQELILELRQVPILRALGPSLLAQLAQSVEVSHLPPEAAIVQFGKSVPSVSFLLGGRARWSRESRSLGEAQTGAAIGLLEIVAQREATASAYAIDTVRIGRMNADRLIDLIEDSFELVHGVLLAIANELCLQGRRSLGRAACLPSVGVPLPARIDFTERLIRLRMSRPFVRAPIRALAVLAERGEVVRIASGAAVWKRGREARRVLVVLSGEVRDGPTRLRAGDAAGLVEALAARQHEHDARAVAPVVAIAFDIEALFDTLEDEDDLALGLLRASAAELLALRAARALPPDVSAVADRSLPRVLPAH